MALCACIMQEIGWYEKFHCVILATSPRLPDLFNTHIEKLDGGSLGTRLVLYNNMHDSYVKAFKQMNIIILYYIIARLLKI